MGWFKARPGKSKVGPARVIAPKIGSMGRVACTTLNGRRIVAAASHKRGVLIWDQATGEAIGQPLDPGMQTGVWFGTLNDGRVVALTSGTFGVVTPEQPHPFRAWDLTAGEPLWEHNEPHYAPVASVTVSGQPVLVTTGSSVQDVSDGYDDRARSTRGIRVWDLASGELVSHPLSQLKDYEVGDIEACAVIGGRPLVVTKPSHGCRQVWDLTTGEPIGGRIDDSRIIGPATTSPAALKGRIALVTGETVTSNVLVWNPQTTALIGTPIELPSRPIKMLCTTLNGRGVLVSAFFNGDVQVWDLARRVKLSTHESPESVKTYSPAVRSVACAVDTIAVGYSEDVAVIDYPGIGR
jgi:WD40 repeat protein